MNIVEKINLILENNDNEACYSSEENHFKYNDKTIDNLIIIKTFINLSDKFKHLFDRIDNEEAFNREMKTLLSTMSDDDYLNMSFLVRELR